MIRRYQFFLGIPVVKIEYMATWEFNKPSKDCDYISTLLSYSKEMTEEIRMLCNTSAVNISFQYRTLAFKVNISSISKAS